MAKKNESLKADFVAKLSRTVDVSTLKWKPLYIQNRNDNWENNVQSESGSEKKNFRTGDFKV